MKTIKYIATASGDMTYYTSKFTLQYDVNGNVTGATHNSYTFTPGVAQNITDDDDANELLLNGVFQEVV